MDLQLLRTYDGLYKEIFACYGLMNIVESLSPAPYQSKTVYQGNTAWD